MIILDPINFLLLFAKSFLSKFLSNNMQVWNRLKICSQLQIVTKKYFPSTLYSHQFTRQILSQKIHVCNANYIHKLKFKKGITYSNNNQNILSIGRRHYSTIDEEVDDNFTTRISPEITKETLNFSTSDKTYVSSHYQIADGDLLSYLERKGLKLRTTADAYISMFCPFCKPHKGKLDNLWKLYIYRNNGRHHCFRCDNKGSFYDFKKKLGDLNVANTSLAAESVTAR
jgi:hypothetical protein